MELTHSNPLTGETTSTVQAKIADENASVEANAATAFPAWAKPDPMPVALLDFNTSSNSTQTNNAEQQVGLQM